MVPQMQPILKDGQIIGNLKSIDRKHKAEVRDSLSSLPTERPVSLHNVLTGLGQM